MRWYLFRVAPTAHVRSWANRQSRTVRPVKACLCTLPASRARLRTGSESGRAAEGKYPPPLFAVRGAHAAGWLSSLMLSWVRVLRAVRSSAARTAIAAGSSIRSGSPCRSRERRASSAPALRISVRSSGVSGRRGGRRVSCLLALLSLTFFRAGLVGVLSVRGHHLPQTTRRSAITSVPLLANLLGMQRYAPGTNPGNITV
jgi:hypothetical protein